MRLIFIDNIKEGMLLGKTIYGNNGQTLLSTGTELNKNIIERIRSLNFTSIYIKDEISNDIEIVDVISSELRNEMTQKIKGFFMSGNLNKKSMINQFSKDSNKLISAIIDQISNNKEMIINLIDLKNYNDYTYQHSVNVAVLSAVIGTALDYNRKDLFNLTAAAAFHDIGKMMVDHDIISKPGKLTVFEFDEIKKHSQFGYDFVSRNLNLANTSMIGILLHHEKCNGKGYPFGKKCDEITEFAKIIAICDVYDAITSNRVYHKAVLPSEAIEYIMANKDEHFSGKIVDVFLKKVAAFPVGITVGLSNGQSGVVCENTEGFQLRPKVKIISDNKSTPVILDLSLYENSAITIVEML